MAIELLERGEAQEAYEKAKAYQGKNCFFLSVENDEKYLGKCTEYQHRPLICRAFGVSARHGKNERIEFSVCQVLKEQKSDEFQKLLAGLDRNELKSIPFIDQEKGHIAAIDPRFLEREYPIAQSLTIILEKVLLLAQYD